MTRRLFCPSLALLTGCFKPKPKPNQYNLKGAVIRLVPQYKLAIIKHEAITDVQGKVWMEAMTMEFPVRDPVLFARLKKGDVIRARVYELPEEHEYWIGDLIEVR